MKRKFLFLTLIVIVLAGCSSDSNNGSLPINEENLLGNWYFKGIRIDNGAFETHDHNCPTSKDDMEILISHTVNYNRYGTDCGISNIVSGSWSLEGNMFTFNDYDPIVAAPGIYKILSITEEQLVLQRDFHPISPSETETYRYFYTRN